MIGTTALARASPRPGARVGIGGAASKVGGLRGSQSVRRFRDAGSLIRALRSGLVQGAVRGDLPAADFLRALGRDARTIQRGVLLEPRRGRGVVLGPVGIVEGHTVRRRADFGVQCAELLADAGLLTEDPLIAVLALGRQEDSARGPRIARSLRDAEATVRLMESEGLDAFSAGVLLEDVLESADIVVAPDGASGNLLFRALHLVGGMPSYGALCVGTRLTLVDTSRARATFERPIRLAAHLARARGGS